jgi:hypothetical protein
VIIPITVGAWPVAHTARLVRVWRWMRATGWTLMHGVVAFLVTLAIALLAAIGAMLVHYNFLQADSFGIGMGVFALVGAFMLYRIYFWHE